VVARIVEILGKNQVRLTDQTLRNWLVISFLPYDSNTVNTLATPSNRMVNVFFPGCYTKALGVARPSRCTCGEISELIRELRERF
jgi:hypothetical protein